MNQRMNESMNEWLWPHLVESNILDQMVCLAKDMQAEEHLLRNLTIFLTHEAFRKLYTNVETNVFCFI